MLWQMLRSGSGLSVSFGRSSKARGHGGKSLHDSGLPHDSSRQAICVPTMWLLLRLRGPVLLQTEPDL